VSSVLDKLATQYDKNLLIYSFKMVAKQYEL